MEEAAPTLHELTPSLRLGSGSSHKRSLTRREAAARGAGVGRRGVLGACLQDGGSGFGKR